MSRKIQFKRGLAKDLPALSEGEFGFTTDTKKPFIGSNTGNVELAKQETMDAELSKVTQQLADTSEQVMKGERVTEGILSDIKLNNYGFNSLNIMGDSITHGANALDINDNSWASVVRKGLQLENNSLSHGYVNFLSELNNTGGRHFDVHDISHNWTPSNDNNVLGLYLLTSNTTGAEITITPKIDFNYFAIAYEQKVSGGSLEIYVNDVLKHTINTAGAIGEKNKKSVSINISTVVVKTIRIKKIQSNGTTVHGIWYMNTPDEFMLNNYARSGAQLNTINNDVLDIMMNGNTVIFALGHNDEAYYPASLEPFKSKLEACKTFYDVHKPQRVLVLDFIWQKRRPDYMNALKEFAEYTNGVYLDFWKVDASQELIDKGLLSDTSHPTPLGHKIIAEKVLRTLNASYKTKNVVSKLRSEQNVFYIGKDVEFANNWKNMLDDKKYASKYQKTNRTVTISFWVTGGASGTPICVLPTFARPPFNVSYSVQVTPTDVYRVDVKENGEVSITVTAGTRTHFAFNYSYVSNV